MKGMLIFLDYFLTAFHLIFVLFVLSGWYWKKTRLAHRWALIFTISAWFLIGWYVGTIGYCPLTDWHWDIKRSLGETNIPSSFIQYLVENWAGLYFDKKVIDFFTVLGLLFGITLAIVKSLKKKKASMS